MTRRRRLGYRARLIGAVARDRDFWGFVQQRLEARVHSSLEMERAEVGRGTYFNGGANLVRYDIAVRHGLTVGAYCSIADGVEFMIAGNHHPEWVSTYTFWEDRQASEVELPTQKGPINVGNDVWIGRQAMIMSGVTIGDGAVVAARALVTRDVAPYAIVGGMPAREIRRRFAPEEIDRLLLVKWWEWPEDELRRIVPLINGTSLAAFFEYADRRPGEARPV